MQQKRLFGTFFFNKKPLLFLFLMLIFFVILFFIGNYFYVKKVILVADFPQEKIIGFQSLSKQNLLFLNKEQLEKEVLQKNPFLKKVQIDKVYPDKLRLKITIDKPFAALKADNGYFYLSETSKIIEKQKENTQKLPVVNYSQKIYYSSYQAGQKVDYREILGVLKLLKKTNDLGLVVDAVDIAGTYMVAFKIDEKKIIFSFDKDLEEQEEALKMIIKQFRIEGKDFATLDLRFNKPLIKVK